MWELIRFWREQACNYVCCLLQHTSFLTTGCCFANLKLFQHVVGFYQLASIFLPKGFLLEKVLLRMGNCKNKDKHQGWFDMV